MARYRAQRNYGCRIHDAYQYQGMRTMVLENDLVRISLLLDKGTDVFEYVYKPTGLDLMWLSEQGVHNPSDYLPTSPDPQSTFLDYYPGGWQEVFPNGGPMATYRGAQFGQHGEVSHMPWDYTIVEDRPECIAVRFTVRTKKAPFELCKTLTLTADSPQLRIHEEVENRSGTTMDFMWGHHLVYGRPFVGPGSVIELPDGIEVLSDPTDVPTDGARTKHGPKQRWPIVRGNDDERIDLSVLPEPRTPSDIVYLTGFEDVAWYTVCNPDKGVGVRVQWDAAAFPYLWFWQEFGATTDYPWYGRHYNIGLEPFSSYPTQGLPEAIRNHSAKQLGPYETSRFQMSIAPFVMD